MIGNAPLVRETCPRSVNKFKKIVFHRQCVLSGPKTNQKNPNTQFHGHKILQPIKHWNLETPVAVFFKSRNFACDWSRELNNHIKMIRRITLGGAQHSFKITRPLLLELKAKN